MGLIVDTGVFIRIERTGDPTPLRVFGRDNLLLMSAITVSELLMGVQLASSVTRREARSAQVEALIAEIPAIPFTASIARTHARIKADLQIRGQMIGAHDLIIAATALEHGHPVLTTNRREFDRIAGLAVVEPPA